MRSVPDTRTRIVEAALATLREEGIAGVSARAVARRGGFNQALIFYHFGSVEGLLVAVARGESERRSVLYAAALRDVTSLAELVAVARRLHDEEFKAGTVAALTQMLAGAVGSDELARGIRDALQPWTALVGDTIARLLEGTPYAGLLPRADLTAALAALFLGIELYTGLDPDAATGSLFTTMGSVAALIDGLLTLAPPTPEGAAMAPGPSGIDTAELSADVRPQDDLFRHVNSRWLAETEIPPDRAAHGAFHLLHDQAELDVRALAEAAAASDAPAGSDERKVGDLWGSFMDEAGAEARDADPLADDLAAIRAVASTGELAALLGRLERHGTPGLVGWYVDNDGEDATRYIVNLVQGGLGLPDEAYYREDAYAEVRAAYVEHVATMLGLVDEPDPAGAAERVMALETALAAGHWTMVDSRDALKTYNKHTRDGLDELAPGVDWAAWLAGLEVPAGAVDQVIVRQPSAVTTAGRLLGELPLGDWRAWLVFHHVRGAAPFLSRRFVDANFAFYGTRLSGIPELRERWKRGVAVLEGALGEAVGRLYVARHFPPEHKAHMQRLVGWLVEAYRVDIEALDWMSADTRARALAKLERFTPKIGYPDRWRDYTALEIVPGDLLGNVRRAEAFEADRNLGKIGRPIDRDEWHMTPQTVNAYYNPGMNEIVFPAAILRWPFFDPDADDAVNFGGIGAVIGHEIGHGFDDQGSRYDGDGNLADWWTDEDRKGFDERAQALIAQYDGFEPRDLPDHHVNGALTVGENIGDLGGITIAHKAYRLSLGGAEAPVIDGMTGSQRVFLGWAQVWRMVVRTAEQERRLAIDPHSPPEFRANVVRNLDEFHEAFGVTDADGMWLAPESRVRIW
jgi:putative endopeptidase